MRPYARNIISSEQLSLAHVAKTFIPETEWDLKDGNGKIEIRTCNLNSPRTPIRVRIDPQNRKLLIPETRRIIHKTQGKGYVVVPSLLDSRTGEAGAV